MWQFKTNFMKTATIIFTTRLSLLVFNYVDGAKNIRFLLEYKYGGVLFTPTVEWQNHSSLIFSEALRRLGCVRRTLKLAKRETKVVA